MTSIAHLHHAVDETLVLAALVLVSTFTVASFLRHQSHRQLSNVDRVVRVMVTCTTGVVSLLSTAPTVRGSARCVLVDQVEVDVVHHGSRLRLHVTIAIVT